DRVIHTSWGHIPRHGQPPPGLVVREQSMAPFRGVFPREALCSWRGMAGSRDGETPSRIQRHEQHPQSARRNKFLGEHISRWFLLLSADLSASHDPGAANSLVASFLIGITACTVRSTGMPMRLVSLW